MNPHIKPVVSAVCAAMTVLAAPHAAAQNKAEVIHWWTSGGESAAIQEFAKAFTKAGGVWVDSAVAGGDAARSQAINRIVGGTPPMAAQFNTSKQYHDLIAEGLLNDVDAVAAKEGWEKLLPAPIISSIKVNGHFYAVPVNIHMPSWFWYSKSAFAKAGISAEPKTPDEFFAALDKLKGAGVVPLAFGGQTWQESLTFSGWLAQAGGTELYLKFFRDRDAASVASPPFRKVLTDYKRLKSYTDAGSPGRNWNDDGHHRQGRRADHGRLGQGRVPGRQANGGKGIRLLPGLRREVAVHHRR